MKIIEIVADQGYQDTILSIAEQHEATDIWMGVPGGDSRLAIRLLVDGERIQVILDAIQSVISKTSNPRVVVIPVEAVLPRPVQEEAVKEKVKSVQTSREELYDDIEKSVRLDRNFLVLVFLSTIVAAIGLIEDNVAVVIGAMVIAPLLGPNLALALGTALGDTVLMWKSMQTNLAGLGVALGLAVIIALLWPVNIASHELLARTDVGLDSVVLALASGAAAVLSITTGLPSVLVGVMVAVALLPPAATFGLMLGSGQFRLAMGAGLLLAVNVVCVNLAAKVVFMIQGVHPRTWLEKQKARQSMTLYIMIWTVSLAILIFAIYLRG